MHPQKILVCFPFVESHGKWNIPIGSACVDALKGLGFQVETFNPLENLGCSWLDQTLERICVEGGHVFGGDRSRIKAGIPWGEESKRFRNLVDKAHQCQPDILFVISTFTYSPKVLDRLRRDCGVKKMIGWCVEGPTWLKDPNQEAALYDHYFCIHEHGIHHPSIQHLPALGFDPDTYSHLPGTPKTHDLVFVGREKKRRVEWLSQLRDCKLELFGPGWQKTALSTNLVADFICGPELNQLYNASKIVLNVSAWANDTADCLNLRILDVPATGSLLLTDYAPGIDQYLIPGKEVVVVKTPGEMLEAARYYLAHEDERELIASAGLARVRQLETYPQKMRRLLESCAIQLPAA